MTKRKKKLKVRQKGKQYPIDQSPLYKLSSLKKLSILLKASITTLKELKNISDSQYNTFLDVTNREIQEPINDLYYVHNELASLLSRISTPSYLHSFKKNHSYITNSEAHLNSKEVITFDIKSFYQSISRQKIKSLFNNIFKCSPDIAYLLSKICSYNNHVPTGSQASIYLIFLANQEMFNEMYRLANASNINMTVYVDDITISGDKVDMSMFNTMSKIVKRHGYTINKKKTRRYLGSQTPIVTGVALNGGILQPTYKRHKALRNKSNFILRNAGYLDTKLLEKEYSSLNGSLNNFSQLKSPVSQDALEAKSKLGTLLGK